MNVYDYEQLRGKRRGQTSCLYSTWLSICVKRYHLTSGNRQHYQVSICTYNVNNKFTHLQLVPHKLPLIVCSVCVVNE